MSKTVMALLGGLPLFGAEDGQKADDPETTGADQKDTPTEEEQPEEKEKTFSKADFDSVVKESKAYRKRAQDAEAQLAELRQAEMSELEKTKADKLSVAAERDQALALLRKERFNMAVLREASASKFVDPGDAIQLISIDSVEVDEDGVPNSVSLRAAIKRLADSKPYLVGSTTAGNGEGGSKGGSGVNKVAAFAKEYQDKGMVPIP